MSVKEALEEKAFIPFIVAGYPDFEKSLEIAKAVIDGGADVLEIGIPFSDPAADGETIQNAYQKSLKKGFNVSDFFKYVKKIRKFSEIPIIVLTYYNLIYQKGFEDFYRKAKEIGVNGVLIADMPIEESEKALKAAEKSSLNQIFLVSATTSEERIKEINKKASGFIYIVSHLSTTGAKKNFSDQTEKLIKKIKSQVNLPVAVGFGISKPSHVKKAKKAGSDGVIVGSAIIDLVSDNKGLDEIKNYIKEMKGPLNSD